MSESSSRESQAFGTYKVIAFVSVVAMGAIAAIAMKSFSHVSDAGMFAIAIMVLAPAFLGVGVSFFVYMSSAAAGRANRPHRDDDPFAGDAIREIGRT